jgi:hypothetical protein
MKAVVTAATAAAKTSHFSEQERCQRDARRRGVVRVADAQARVVRSPTTEATSAGTSASYSMRPSTTNSRPKTAPAMGVPNTEPKPPATPAASSCCRTARHAQPVRDGVGEARPHLHRGALAPGAAAEQVVSTVPTSTIGAIRSGISGPSSWMVSMTRLLPP